jgi:hypothetical protein
VLLLSLICVDWSGVTCSTISQVKNSEDESKQGLGMGAAMAFALGVHGTCDSLYLSFVLPFCSGIPLTCSFSRLSFHRLACLVPRIPGSPICKRH